MNLLRRRNAPTWTWLLGLGIGTACASMMACISPSTSSSGYSGWGPLGGNGDSTGSTPDATTSSSTPENDTDAGATGAEDDGASDGGANAAEGSATDGASSDAPSDGSGIGPNFTLLNTLVTGVINGSPVHGFDPIPNDATINIGVVGSALSIRANTVPAVVGSVGFALDATYTHTENTAPYCLCSDDGKGDIDSCANILTVGKHTLTATAYTGTDLTGDAGAPIVLDFTITDVADAGGQ
jgi:hypothetical protein